MIILEFLRCLLCMRSQEDLADITPEARRVSFLGLNVKMVVDG